MTAVDALLSWVASQSRRLGRVSSAGWGRLAGGAGQELL